MAKKKKKGVWREDIFEDIRSHSEGVEISEQEYIIKQDILEHDEAEKKAAEKSSKKKRRPAADKKTKAQSNSKNTQKKSGQGGAKQRSEAGRPRPEARPKNRPKSPESELPQWDASKRTSRPGKRPLPPEMQKQKIKRQMKSGTRKALAGFTIFTMAAVTVLLAIFLLFKVTDIRITGNAAANYDAADILGVCGYREGDNLVFLPTSRQENKLEEEFPYVARAKIKKRFPGTVEIDLTATDVSASVMKDDRWLLVSSGGKILEVRDKPDTEGLKVIGMDSLTDEPGLLLKTEDEAVSASCRAVLSTLEKLKDDSSELFYGVEFTDFDILDLSNVSDIALYYQDRIKFDLGNSLELEYKITLGCTSLPSLGENETGVMDLSFAADAKKAVFTVEEIHVPQIALNEDEPPAEEPAPETPPEPDENEPENGEPDEGSDRGEGIPEDPYTG